MECNSFLFCFHYVDALFYQEIGNVNRARKLNPDIISHVTVNVNRFFVKLVPD